VSTRCPEIDVVDFLAQTPLTNWAEVARQHWLALALAGVSLVGVVLLLRVIFRRRRAGPPSRADLTVDVSVLPDVPPPRMPPVLEFYHFPVRLVAVVLAPVGRASELPAREELPEVIDSIVPGLDAVAAAHEPLVRAWPRQVSTRGFAHAFFQNLRMPGDRGKRSVWSAVAGMIRVGDEPMMAGLVLRAETPNRYGNVIMEEEDQWLAILRVRLS
jgi:hypothetical protein